MRRCGEQKLSTVTDNVPQRYHLDTIWDEDPIQLMLEKYFWTFARKTVEWNYNSAIEPDFGYQYAFDHPTDYVRLVEISLDEYFRNPFRDYRVENDYWFCDFETLYVVYISNDSAYGKDYSKWTKLFENMVATYMAQQLSLALNKSKSDKQELKSDMDELHKRAKSLDAMESPTRHPPECSWVSSRRGGRKGDSNRGPILG
ncbi:MAG: hypothetical protein P8Y45_04805 [Exilibacterium sp.]